MMVDRLIYGYKDKNLVLGFPLSSVTYPIAPFGTLKLLRMSLAAHNIHSTITPVRLFLVMPVISEACNVYMGGKIVDPLQ